MAHKTWASDLAHILKGREYIPPLDIHHNQAKEDEPHLSSSVWVAVGGDLWQDTRIEVDEYHEDQYSVTIREYRDYRDTGWDCVRETEVGTVSHSLSLLADMIENTYADFEP